MERLEELERRQGRRLRNVGGTSGGLAHFLVGGIMLVLGSYWLMQHVWVMSHPWRIFGYDGFGISLVPLLFGVGMLFFNSKNPIGWLLAVVGLLIIFGGIISSLNIFFRPTSLLNTLIIFVLMAGGLGLIGRSMRSL